MDLYILLVETEETDHQQKGNEQDITESNADNRKSIKFSIFVKNPDGSE